MPICHTNVADVGLQRDLQILQRYGLVPDKYTCKRTCSEPLMCTRSRCSWKMASGGSNCVAQTQSC